MGRKARRRRYNVKFPINKWNKNITDSGRFNVKTDSHGNSRGKKRIQRASNSIKTNNKSLKSSNRNPNRDPLWPIDILMMNLLFSYDTVSQCIIFTLNENCGCNTNWRRKGQYHKLLKITFSLVPLTTLLNFTGLLYSLMMLMVPGDKKKMLEILTMEIVKEHTVLVVKFLSNVS